MKMNQLMADYLNSFKNIKKILLKSVEKKRRKVYFDKILLIRIRTINASYETHLLDELKVLKQRILLSQLKALLQQLRITEI